MSNSHTALGLQEGSLIHGRYEIQSLLGRGGFAAVFRAFDNEIERDVAIKVLNVGPLVSQGNELDLMLKRFKREAKLSARITHPCVVQIFDFGVLDDRKNPFIIMEMLEGHDLGDELRDKGGMSPTRTIPLFIDALEALGDAHDMGIVHKDLKPSNLFLTDPGARRETMKIVDFGIAHIGADDDEGRLTQTGYMLGTTKYMAPEYVEEQEVSPALDVYQMGLILVESLAGKPVVTHESPWKCALMHVSRELSIPVELLESPLGPIIEKSLALRPEDRYPSASHFAEALTTVDPAVIPELSMACECRTLDANSSEVLAPNEQSQQVLKRALTNRMAAEAAEAEAEAESDDPSDDTKKSHTKDVDFHEAKTEFTASPPTGKTQRTGAQDVLEDQDDGGSEADQKASVTPSSPSKIFGSLSSDDGEVVYEEEDNDRQKMVAIVSVVVVAVLIAGFMTFQLLGEQPDSERDVEDESPLSETEPTLIADDPVGEPDPPALDLEREADSPEEDEEERLAGISNADAGLQAEEEADDDELDDERSDDDIDAVDEPPAPDPDPTPPEPRPDPTPAPTPAPTPDPPQDDPGDETGDDDDDDSPGFMIAP